MSNSDYHAQVGLQEVSRDEALAWFQERAQTMRDAGATWVRYSIVEQHELLVTEGWNERPEDEGEPTVYLVALDEGGDGR